MTQAAMKTDRIAPRGPVAIDPPPSGSVSEMWMRRRGLARQLWRLWVQREAAIARMPSWAAPGPKNIDTRGRRVGEIVSWPEVKELTLAKVFGSVRIARPSPSDLRRTLMHPMFGEEGVVKYRAALRELAVRRRAQRAEEARVGLSQIQRSIRDLENIIDTVSEAITDHTEHSFNAVAAKILIHAQFGNSGSSPAELALEFVLPALKATRPGLTGAIAVDVEEVLLHPGRAIEDCGFYAF